MRNLFLLLIGTFLVSEVFPAEIVIRSQCSFPIWSVFFVQLCFNGSDKHKSTSMLVY